MNRRTFLTGAAASLGLPFIQPAKADDAWAIRYTSSEDLRCNLLAHKALKLVMARMSKPYRLVPSDVSYPTQAAAANALRNGAIDVAWFGAARGLSDDAMPIPFPLDRGLFGYRVFLINRSTQAQFSQVHSLEHLRQFTALQGEGWTDIPILENAGIPVSTGLPENLYRMVARGRGDFFPRGASEAVRELLLQQSAVPGLALEETLVLKYPFALMFYVNNGRKHLVEDFMRSLEAASEDGSYEEMFYADETVKSALEGINLSGRRKIELQNPFCCSSIATIKQKYWI